MGSTPSTSTMITSILTKMFYFLFKFCIPLRTAADDASSQLYYEHLEATDPLKGNIIFDDGPEPELDTEP